MLQHPDTSMVLRGATGMCGRACVGLVLTLVAVSDPAYGQRYQRYSDGLVRVHAKRTTADEAVGVELCAEVLRTEEACPVEVHFVFRGASGQILGQRSPVLQPHFGAPACTRVDLPAEARDLVRWEIARFGCARPEKTPADAARARRPG
jgi:hypothetical protein